MAECFSFIHKYPYSIFSVHMHPFVFYFVLQRLEWGWDKAGRGSIILTSSDNFPVMKSKLVKQIERSR